MIEFFTFVACVVASLIALIVAVAVLAITKLTLRSLPSMVEALFDVNWKFCIGHSALGFVVSLLVAPSLPVPLVAAAGVVSTVLVAMFLQHLEQIELNRPAPTPAPARVRLEIDRNY